MKIVLIIVPLLLILGGGFFAAQKGLVNIPGITPKKKPTAVAKAPETTIETKKRPAPKPPPTPSLDEGKGQQQLASLWNGIDAEQLKEITKPWTVRELAPVLMKMEPDKITEFLAAVDAKRASEISKEIKRIASLSAG